MHAGSQERATAFLSTAARREKAAANGRAACARCAVGGRLTRGTGLAQPAGCDAAGQALRLAMQMRFNENAHHFKGGSQWKPMLFRPPSWKNGPNLSGNFSVPDETDLSCSSRTNLVYYAHVPTYWP